MKVFLLNCGFFAAIANIRKPNPAKYNNAGAKFMNAVEKRQNSIIPNVGKSNLLPLRTWIKAKTRQATFRNVWVRFVFMLLGPSGFGFCDYWW